MILLSNFKFFFDQIYISYHWLLQIDYIENRFIYDIIISIIFFYIFNING